jgi:hypothetical protein
MDLNVVSLTESAIQNQNQGESDVRVARQGVERRVFQTEDI